MTRTGYLPLLGALCLSLTACETMGNAMSSTKNAFSSMGNKIASVEFPTLSSADEAAATTEIIATGCPKIETTEMLREIHLFTDPAQPSEKGRVSSFGIASIEDSCRHRNNNVIVEISINFEGNLGPAGRSSSSERPSFAYPYFIAIEGKGGQILAKEIFATTVSYNKTSETVTHSDNMRQIIPIAPNSTGDDYSIFVGFQLTDEELMYNQAMLTAPPAL